MKRYIKPNTEVILMQSEPVMGPVSGNTFTGAPNQLNLSGAGDATSDAAAGGARALGKESTISSNSVWDEEE